MIKKIISVLLLFIFFCFPFLSTNANYNKEIKFTKEEIKNIEKFFEEYSKNSYETRGVKTWLTKEGLKNIASGLRGLQYNTIARWVTDKSIGKKAGEELFENFRKLAKKFDDFADSMDFVESAAIKTLAELIRQHTNMSHNASTQVAKMLISWFM